MRVEDDYTPEEQFTDIADTKPQVVTVDGVDLIAMPLPMAKIVAEATIDAGLQLRTNPMAIRAGNQLALLVERIERRRLFTPEPGHKIVEADYSAQRPEVPLDEVTGEAERCPYCKQQYHQDDEGLYHCGCEDEGP